jgi:hypothetical protein
MNSTIPMTGTTGSTANVAGTNPAAIPASMQLSGTLRQRGTDLYLEQSLRHEPGHASGWTTPSTDATVQSHIDRLVTVTGDPNFDAAQHRTFVVLATVEPLEDGSSMSDRSGAGAHETAPAPAEPSR